MRKLEKNLEAKMILRRSRKSLLMAAVIPKVTRLMILKMRATMRTMMINIAKKVQHLV